MLDVRRATLSDLVNGNMALSAEMALRIEKAFGIEMETLLNMQAWHDAYAMRQREGEIVVKPTDPPLPTRADPVPLALCPYLVSAAIKQRYGRRNIVQRQADPIPRVWTMPRRVSTLSPARRLGEASAELVRISSYASF